MIKTKEYQRRRKQLMRMIGDGSVAILPAAPAALRNGDVEYPYRQDSDFYYLSGFSEPAAVIVLVPGREAGEAILFCREKDPKRAIWDGPRIGPEGAVDDYGFSDAFPIDDLDDILPGLIEGKSKLFYTLGRESGFDKRLIDWVNGIRAKIKVGAKPPEEIVSLDHLIHDMRLYKTATELTCMQRASDIGSEAHIAAMQACRPGMNEAEIMAELQRVFVANQAPASYLPIVAGGENACILHYIANNQPLPENGLLLIDAGCEVDCYASDITRTFPVNGTFSAEQKAIYEIVLQAQLDAIDAMRPGRSWIDGHDAAVRTITVGLIDVGIIRTALEQALDEKLYQKYFMHKTGHWLGLDVHDVGDYKFEDKWRELEKGMVLTVEPGIYVSGDDESVADRWRGIGIRIEDDVAITDDEPRVLSAKAPKTVSDIEACMTS